MKTLGNILDNKTLETVTTAEQLITGLSELNVLIEGTVNLPFIRYNINNNPFTLFKCIRHTLRPGAFGKL